MADCSLEDLGDEIAALVGEYVDEVDGALEEDVRAAADAARDAAEAGSPRKSGKYARGWVAEPDAESPTGKAYRVHNRAKPGLTHLLEKGHGGPHAARPHPHIADAAQVGMDELERRLNG